MGRLYGEIGITGRESYQHDDGDRASCPQRRPLDPTGIYPAGHLQVLRLPLFLQDLLPNLSVWTLPRPRGSARAAGSARARLGGAERQGGGGQGQAEGGGGRAVSQQ